MKLSKKLAVLGSAFIIGASSLAGCGLGDKSAAKEAAEKFLEALKTGNENDINSYSSGSVATGNFVKLFDSDYLVDVIKGGFDDVEVTDEASEKIDEFCSVFSSMIKDYEVSKVELNDDKSATAIATIDTAFPINVFESDDAKARLEEVTGSYYDTHSDEIQEIINSQGEDAVKQKIYDDMISIVLDTYKSIIDEAQSETYAIALTLKKNTETGTWYVTEIKNYDAYKDPTNAEMATDTATTDPSLLSSTDASSDSSSEN
ncbi:MAG: hypothetical protein K6G10_10220 [Butyrivibrio sp.]|nr:hypothetical protein [Butyrivibrio sp.]